MFKFIIAAFVFVSSVAQADVVFGENEMLKCNSSSYTQQTLSITKGDQYLTLIVKNVAGQTLLKKRVAKTGGSPTREARFIFFGNANDVAFELFVYNQKSSPEKHRAFLAYSHSDGVADTFFCHLNERFLKP